MLNVKKKKIAKRNGEDVYLFRITNRHGSYVELMNYGATLVSVVVPDRNGKLGNVALGFSSFEDYLHDDCYIGSTVGRFANRIGNASFQIGGKQFSLDQNDTLHSNHGGFNGFNSKLFDVELFEDGLRFSLESPDGEGGFPGILKFQVVYRWNEKQELHIEYQAESDQDTVVNFTNHAYFNLSAMDENALQQTLTIAASKIVECTPDFIPTGKIIPTGLLDFQQQKIADKINWKAEGLKGINSYYILDAADYSMAACCLYDERSGRQLDVFTSYPGVQLYTGDYLKSTKKGNHGTSYQPFDGICLECQSYPDSPNYAHFPSTLLKAGSNFQKQINYRFSHKI